MKRWVHAAEEVKAVDDEKQPIEAMELRDYTVEISFGGYGSSELYQVTSASEDEAKDEALEEAKDDLGIDNIEDLGDGEWEVTVGFAGMIGVENMYTVDGEDEDEARENALNEAEYDLDVEEVYSDDEEIQLGDEDDEDIESSIQVEELSNHEAFLKWLNEYFGYDWDGENHVNIMDIPEDEYYALEDQYREETGREVA